MFFLLNSAKHEIIYAHMHKNKKKCSFSQARISIECLFPAHKCKNANIYEQENFMLSWVEQEFL